MFGLLSFQLFATIDTSNKHFYMSVLCTYMTSEYRSELPVSDMNPPFLRALKTSKFPGTPLCPYLEQPNLVSGLPAQCKWWALKIWNQIQETYIISTFSFCWHIYKPNFLDAFNANHNVCIDKQNLCNFHTSTYCLLLCL